jgi:hypothetical protein
MKVIEIIEVRDCLTDLIRVEEIEHQGGVGDIANVLRSHVFCGHTNMWPVDLSVGSKVAHISIAQDISDDRECIEKGYNKTQHFIFDRNNDARFIKYWRRLLLLLLSNERLMH